MTLTNWAGNYAYLAPVVQHPRSVEELSQIVASSPQVRALGTRHCFNDLADGPGTLVALDGLPSSVRIDPDARTVTVSAGTRYGTLAEELHESGWALGNLASLPHISVAGAIATATHGSGDRSQNLAAAVCGLRLVSPDGSLRSVVRGDDDFAGSVVALGALGIAVEVTLDIEHTYEVAQEVHEELPWEAALANLDEVTSSAGSVSLFTDWRGSSIQQVWRKTRVSPSFEPRADFHGATPATAQRHPLPGIDPVHTTAQLASAGPWHERLPHFRLDFTPSNGAELQSEYLVPRSSAVDALQAVRALSDQIAPLLQVSEIRTIAGDDLWLSTASGGDRVGIHFTWHPKETLVAALLPTIEAALAPFEARPHWGKLFADDDRSLARLYPRWDDFRSLVARTDPDGVFRNAFLDRHVLQD
ncbi:D-arabinono-1,4-lactone oxidase [Cellulomonas sp. URHE0023]|uniref:D-arabinono-1,4-lactone oxidase n=1 Tax=Cellulomonas sp. URHE0023 TaxID=1380354 RepID=UPI0004868229|nr:D-arabinono-1,4-lactone oxidase [Cellulomonas sp. URHE0023]